MILLNSTIAGVDGITGMYHHTQLHKISILENHCVLALGYDRARGIKHLALKSEVL
jgi:hypothetical protein